MRAVMLTQEQPAMTVPAVMRSACQQGQCQRTKDICCQPCAGRMRPVHLVKQPSCCLASTTLHSGIQQRDPIKQQGLCCHAGPSPAESHAARGILYIQQHGFRCLGGTLTCRVAARGVYSQRTRRCSAGLPPRQTPSGRARCLGYSADPGRGSDRVSTRIFGPKHTPQHAVR